MKPILSQNIDNKGRFGRGLGARALRVGALMNWLFVRRDVEKIFAFRQECLRTFFPRKAGD